MSSDEDTWSQLQIHYSDLRASISEVQSLTLQYKERTEVLLQQLDKNQAWTRDQHHDQQRLMLLQQEQQELKQKEESILRELQQEEELCERLKEEAQDTWFQLQIDHSDLRASISEVQSLTLQYKERTEVLLQQLDKNQAWTRDQHHDQQRLMLLQQEQQELKQKEESILRELQQEEELCERLKEEAQVLSVAPERLLVFRGATAPPADAPLFHMEAQVHLPMEGGTALITFEEKEVAQRILSMHKHKVDLGGDFYMNVEARGVCITSPCSVEVQVQVCPHMVLVSGLPQMDAQTLEDQLYVHFSRSKNGGGEVEEVHLQEGGGTATISFIQDDVSKRLTQKQFHDVKLTEGVHRVRVSPFVSGDITHLQSRRDQCLRTVLLTGIPDVADPESLQDLMEIHFQRSSSGGGEVEGLLYCPEGGRRTALLCSPKKRE